MFREKVVGSTQVKSVTPKFEEKKCGQCGIGLIKKQSTTKTSRREGLKQAVKI